MFEFMPQENTSYRNVDEREALALIRNYTRDAAAALERMRANPFAQLVCEGGRLRYNPGLPSSS